MRWTRRNWPPYWHTSVRTCGDGTIWRSAPRRRWLGRSRGRGSSATARDEATRLVELLADDNATRSAGRLELAEAMLNLADRAPAGALSAGGTAAGTRVRRLIKGHRPLAVWVRALGLIGSVALVAAPLLMLATPAAAAPRVVRGRASDQCRAVPGHGPVR